MAKIKADECLFVSETAAKKEVQVQDGKGKTNKEHAVTRD
jgi:hypothetical protein